MQGPCTAILVVSTSLLGVARGDQPFVRVLLETGTGRRAALVDPPSTLHRK